MKPLLLIFAFFLLLYNEATGQVPDSLKFRSLGPADFKSAYLKDSLAMLIDVREFFEFRKSRLTGAVNIPASGKTENAADTIQKECALFLYCTSGVRSKRVARIFYDHGLRKLSSLDGGIVGWRKGHFPLDRTRRKKIDSSSR
jgi:rhodanese-related sulfurtransferase